MAKMIQIPLKFRIYKTEGPVTFIHMLLLIVKYYSNRMDMLNIVTEDRS